MKLEDPREKFERARALSKDPDRLLECASLYEAAAADGLPEAQVNLGAMLESGDRGLPRDLSRAAELYAAAARQGLSAAQYNLARLYDFGKGVQRDPVKAVEFYELAAENGNADAMANLAGMVARGEVGSPDAARAIQWYARAAALGHPLAMRALGLAHLSGEGGVSVDAGRAADCLRRAAEQGDGYSWFELAQLLWHGRGIRRDRLEGLRCAFRAARSEDGWREIVGSLRPWTVRLLKRLHLTS